MSETAPAQENAGYDGAAVLGGALTTFFFPLVALIVALVLHGGQPNPVKRGQLRTWAWVSGGWLLLHVILVVVVILAFFATVSSIHPGP